MHVTFTHPKIGQQLFYPFSPICRGDRVNLGFVVETERQVEDHLTTHLDRLPDADAKSRAIVDTMREDEARHGTMAQDAGAVDLPLPVKGAMRLAAGVMKAVAYRI